MNVFIAGGGRVGFHLARLLSIENHDVTVIEKDPNRVKRVDYTLDVSTIEGTGVSVMLQKEAGVGKADLFVSATGDDEVNLIAAATAKGLGAGQVVARVDDPTYLEANILYETVLGVDYLLSPEALTALDIVKYVENPGLVASESFARGMVKLQQMRVTKSPTSGGKTLKDIDLPPGVLLGVISRKGNALIPHGDSIVEPGDVVTLIGKKDRMASVKDLFQGTDPKLERIVVMGGGSIGFHLAQVLQNRQVKVKVFDWNMERCKVLAATLDKAKVVNRDATTREALAEEHVEDADVFVSTTDDDERNIMAGVLAKEVGVTHTISVVHQPDFVPLVGKLGIDHAVTPRASFANRVLKLVHQKSVSSLAVLEEGQVEVLEFKVTGETPILGKTLKDAFERRVAPGVLVASILRGEHVIVPRGDDEILAGDALILIAAPGSLESVTKLFQK